MTNSHEIVGSSVHESQGETITFCSQHNKALNVTVQDSNKPRIFVEKGTKKSNKKDG